MTQICRTCMSHDKEMIPIYSPTNWPPVDVMILAIASLKLLPNDMLPSNICVTCMHTLQIAYSFKTQVLQTNALLQQAQALKMHAIQANEDCAYVQRSEDIPQRPLEVKIEPCDEDSRYMATNFQVKEEICSDTEFVNVKRPTSACDVQPTIIQFPANNSSQPTENSFEDRNKTTNFDDMSKHTLNEETSGNTSQHNEFVNVNIKRSPSASDSQPAIVEDPLNEPCGIIPTQNASQLDAPLEMVSNYVSLEHTANTLTQKEGVQILSEQQEQCQISLEDRKNVQTLLPSVQQVQKQHDDQEMNAEFDIDDSSSSEVEEPKAKSAGEKAKGFTAKVTKPFKCHVCDYACSKLNALQIHIRVHTGEKPYECEICQAQFAHKPNLKQHLRSHTDQKDGNDKVYKCQICGREFRWPTSLKVHMRTHSGEKPFQCTHCDATFAQKCNLKSHIATHSEEAIPKPHICEMCGKRFRRSNRLKIHMRVHTGERPFKCPYCDTSYRQNSHLTDHLFTHTGEKRPKLHICPVCGKRCTRAQHLKEHMISHTKERAYKCHQCDAAFAYPKTLREHLRKHTKEETQNQIDLSKEPVS